MSSRTARHKADPVGSWMHALGMAMLFALTASTAGAAPREARAAGSSADVPRAPAADPQDLPARLAHLTLIVYDVHELLDSNVTVLSRESSAILEGMGIDVAWRTGVLGTTHGGAEQRQVPVILLKEPPGGLRANGNVLGLIPKNQPVAIWVFVDNVRRAARLGTDDPSPASKSRLAIALGRVLAHEVVHTLAPQLGHTKDGLMRESLDTKALTDPMPPTNAKSSAAVRAALKLGLPSRPPAPPLPFRPAT